MDEDELPDDVYDRVTELSEKGNITLNAGHLALQGWSRAHESPWDQILSYDDAVLAEIGEEPYDDSRW